MGPRREDKATFALMEVVIDYVMDLLQAVDEGRELTRDVPTSLLFPREFRSLVEVLMKEPEMAARTAALLLLREADLRSGVQLPVTDK